jgi:sulfur carrier protein ThiS
VRWFSTLVKRTRSGQAQTVVAWKDGTTPRSIFLDEGFNDADADHVIAAVNGERIDIDTRLTDGDEVEFLVGISGG